MMLPERWQKIIDQNGQHVTEWSYLIPWKNCLFLEKIRNYLVANPIDKFDNFTNPGQFYSVRETTKTHTNLFFGNRFTLLRRNRERFFFSKGSRQPIRIIRIIGEWIKVRLNNIISRGLIESWTENWPWKPDLRNRARALGLDVPHDHSPVRAPTRRERVIERAGMGGREVSLERKLFSPPPLIHVANPLNW